VNERKTSESAVVVSKAYDFMLWLWLLPKAEKFPRSYRFTVGDRLISTGLDLLLLLVEAAYAREKAAMLEAAARKTKRAAVSTAAYFPGDDLFTPFQRRRGLPLGIRRLNFSRTST
jgi:hypothetical protein